VQYITGRKERRPCKKGSRRRKEGDSTANEEGTRGEGKGIGVTVKGGDYLLRPSARLPESVGGKEFQKVNISGSLCLACPDKETPQRKREGLDAFLCI